MDVRRADAVIIGGGSIGASIAYHLALHKFGDVVILERESLGSGATGKSVGGVRQQFSAEVNIRLSQYGVEVLEKFNQEMDANADFRQYGYLFLATSDEEESLFRRNVARQKKLGVPVRLIAPSEAKEIVPVLEIDDVLVATYCPTDGYADPYGVLMGYAKRARELGVTILEGTEAISIRIEADRVVGVDTPRGFIATPVVVNAAGPWGGIVGKMVGVNLPIRTYRVQEFITGPVGEIPKRFPLVVEFSSHLHLRREGDGVLMGWNDPNDEPTFTQTVEWADVGEITERAVRRMPVLANASIKRGWAGLCEMTPDNNAIIGRVPQVQGFFCAVGFSGHGFMHTPGVGRGLAELIVEGRYITIDLTPLSIDRYVRGTLLNEDVVVSSWLPVAEA